MIIMSAQYREDGGAEPLVVRKTGEETNGEYVRFELTLYPREPSGDSQSSTANNEFEFSHRRWPIDFPTEHVHPRQAEHWTVLFGSLGVAYGENEVILSEGETVALPEGVPHRVWNPIDEPSRVTLEFHPALDARSLTETLFVLAQIGETNDSGQLKVLQFAVTLAAHPDQLYLTAMPVRVQKLFVGLLAPVGRRAGYKAAYSLDSLESDR
jgi:mannose-6-phosphate isomerase-like protein (cupin superfamily)